MSFIPSPAWIYGISGIRRGMSRCQKGPSHAGLPVCASRELQAAVASGARKTVEPISSQSLMICAPVLTQIFLVQT